MKPAIFFGGLLSTGLAQALAGSSPGECLEYILGSKNVPVKWINDPAYGDLTEPFNLRLQYKPIAVVIPTTNQHVQDAVVAAGNCGVKVQAKSGGHSYASFSSGGQDGSMVCLTLITLLHLRHFSVPALPCVLATNSSSRSKY
jgi:hypothetical protein